MPPDPVGLALQGQALQLWAEASAGPQRKVPFHSAGYCTAGSWLPGQAVGGVLGVGGREGGKSQRNRGSLTERKAEGKCQSQREKEKRSRRKEKRGCGRACGEEEKSQGRENVSVCAPRARTGRKRGERRRERDLEREGREGAVGSQEERAGGGDEEVGARRRARAGRTASSIPGRSAAGAGAGRRRAGAEPLQRQQLQVAPPPPPRGA